MVLVETYHSSALDQAYPSSPPYWHVDMDPHSTSSIYSGPGSSQAYAVVPQMNEGAGPSIQGWIGQPETPTRTTGYIQGRKGLLEDASYVQAGSDAMTQRPASLSRNGQPSHLVFDAANHSHPSTDLPQRTSQLVHEHAPLQMESPYPPSSRSMGSSARSSQDSTYGYDHASQGSSSMAGLIIMVPRARTYDAPTRMTPAYTYEQFVPQYKTHSLPQIQPSPSSSVNWSETYAATPSTSYSTSPVYSTGTGLKEPVNARPSFQYAQPVMVELPTWTYQHVPVHVYPSEGSTSAPAHYVIAGPVVSPHHLEQQPQGDMDQATSAPQAHYIRAPEHGRMTPTEGGLDAGPGPVRNEVRRNGAIGRVRLLEPEQTSSNSTPTRRLEQPWSKMAHSQTQSGAFTHSGVYGMDPSMPTYATGKWAGEGITQPGSLMPVDSFPFETAAPLHSPSTIEWYCPLDTPGLHISGSVSIPATVATSHVPLPLVSQMSPPLTMGTLPTSVMGTSMLQTDTPASHCQSTFCSEDDQPNDRLSSDPAYDDYQGDKSFAHADILSRSGKASALQVASSKFDGFSRVPLVHTRTPHALEAEDDVEDLQDVHSVYPGLGAPHELSSAAEDSSAPSTTGWQQAGPSGSGQKRIIQKMVTIGALPARTDRMDYSRFGAEGNRPKLVIACQGCRDKKLKCPGERPTCMNCKRRGVEHCEYAVSVRRRGPGRKKIAALGERPTHEAGRQAKARLQNGDMHQEDVPGQYTSTSVQAESYRCQTQN